MKVVSKLQAKTVKTPNIKKNQVEILHKPLLFKFIEKYSFIVFLSLLLLIILFVFRDFIFLKKLYLFKDIGSDSINTFYPTYVLSAQTTFDGLYYTFRDGMGEASYTGGISLIATVIRIMVNPFRFILYSLDKESIAYSLAFLEIAKIIISGIIFHFYLRTMSLSKVVAILGGLFYAFSGIMIGGSGWYQHTFELLYFALILFGFEQALQKKQYFLFLLVLIFTFQALDVFYIYLFGTFILVYALLRISEHKETLKEAVIFIGISAVLVILAFMFNFPSISESIQSSLNQPRVSGNLSKVGQMQQTSIFATEGFLHNVTAVLRLFSNDILGSGKISEIYSEGSRYLIPDYKGYSNYYEGPMFYIGLFSLLFFPQIIYSGNRKQKIIYAIFFTICLIPVIFPYFRRAYFLFLGDYYRTFSVFLPFIILFLALKGFDKIFTGAKLNIYLLGATLLFLLILLNFNYFNQRRLTDLSLQENPVNDNIKLFVNFLLIFYFALLLLINYRKKYKIQILIAILVLSVIELTYLSNITVNKRDHVTTKEFNSKKGYNDFTVEALSILHEKDSSFYRIEKDYASGTAFHGSLNDSKVQGYFGTSSYLSHQNSNYINFLQKTGVIPVGDETAARWASGVRNRPILSVFANVKYMLSKSENPFFKQFGYSLLDKSGDVSIYKNDYFLPLGYTYDNYLKETDFNKLPLLQKDIALLKAVVIPDSLIGEFKSLKEYSIKDTLTGYSIDRLKADTDSLKKEAFEISSFKEDHIQGKLSLKQDKVLFFSILHDENWKLIVNEKKMPTKLVNLGFTGILLQKGDYEIDLSYVVSNNSLYTEIADYVILLLILIYLLTTLMSNKLKINNLFKSKQINNVEG